MTNLVTGTFGGVPARYRPGTTDEASLREVLERGEYRRVKMGFDVEPGEHWLDLGACVGAFALYCHRRHAMAICYEPVADNFEVLRANVPFFDCHQSAVTARDDGSIAFYDSRIETTHTKGTEFEHYWRAVGAPRRMGVHRDVVVSNMCAVHLTAMEYDGVKMDVEGSEGPILDAGWLPRCRKLVLEYHSSVDTSVERLARRLAFLRSRFRRVEGTREMDRVIASGVVEHKAYFDRCIYCMDPL